MFIQRSWLISWPIISLGKILGTMPTPGCFVSTSMKGGSGCGRSGTMLYHCFGMSFSFSRIFLSGIFSPSMSCKSYFKVLFKAFAYNYVHTQTTHLYPNEQKYTQANQNVEPNKNPTSRISRTPQSSTRPHRKRLKRKRTTKYT